MPIFVYKARKPQQPQGQGIFSYGAVNAPALEHFVQQGAPEPAYPQGRIMCRPSRRYIANMGTFTMSNSGMQERFIPYGHELLAVHSPGMDGQKRLIGQSGVNSERANIRKPAAVAYGSLFELGKSY